MKYRSIFISDTHIGGEFCNSAKLLDFISNVECDYLYLVGDIIDGWALKRRFRWYPSHNIIVQKILRMSRKGADVIYCYGNHDFFLKSWENLEFGNIQIVRETIHTTAKGEKLMVLHGDQFDGFIASHKWMQQIGAVIYDLSLKLNVLSLLFHFSLSKFLKKHAKQAVSYINKYEAAVAEYCRINNCDGIVTGHIHNPSISKINGINYYNCGDWVEPGHNTVIVETIEGNIELLYL
jgi:UDP-2,3-diacylglucosamine pyrophosphatase LpxH